MMGGLAFGVWRPAATRANTAARLAAQCALAAPSFNGRTAASGAAYRGSNPWGAAKIQILNGLLRFGEVRRSSFYQQLKLIILDVLLVKRRS
jgi:hypothetical protein